MRQLLQSGTAIRNWDSYYKVGQLLQSEAALKVGQLLQSGAAITK